MSGKRQIRTAVRFGDNEKLQACYSRQIAANLGKAVHKSENHMPIEKREIKSREEWLKWRKQDITASPIGALFNCHPYSTVFRLYAEKRGTEFIHEDNKAMRRGRWMEPAVAKAVEEMRPEWKLEPARHYLRDPELRLGATPDFYIHGDPRGFRHPASQNGRAFGLHARLGRWRRSPAVDHSAGLGRSHARRRRSFIAIAALLVDAHNMDVSIHEMPRNPAAEAKIREAVARFWHDVDHGHRAGTRLRP